MALALRGIGIDVGPFLESWPRPRGTTEAVLVAAWLVEAKSSVNENMPPALTRLVTPLIAAMLVRFLGTLLWIGRGVDIEPNVLIAFDLLLVVPAALPIGPRPPVVRRRRR